MVIVGDVEGDKKLEIFLPKNQHTEKEMIKFWELVYCSGEVSKSAQNWLYMSKIIWIFLLFFKLKNTKLKIIFSYWHFLIAPIFKTLYY